MDKEDRPVEIKDLNKTQLILLAILLSFVVSIATGIVTVTLLQQAPPAVTQTINRVVQQTIEKVVPDYIPGTTQTVVVKEDDLVVDAVGKTRANIVPIFESADSKTPLMNVYSAGSGVFVSKSDNIDSSKTYVVKDGDTPASIKVIANSTNGITILATDSANSTIGDFPKALFGKDSDIKAGQTVIAISSDSIYKDTVQNILEKDQKDAPGVVADKWNVVLLGNTIPSGLIGAPVANLDGNVIGFVTSITNADGGITTQIIGIDAITKLIAKPTKISQAPTSLLPASAVNSITQ